MYFVINILNPKNYQIAQFLLRYHGLLIDRKMTSSEGDFGKYPAYVGIVIALCVIAVLLNLLVIYLVAKDGKFRAPTDIFLTNLAISDILHASVITPIHLKTAAASDHEDFSSNVVCKIIMFLPLLSVMSAIFTVVAIAIDRYRSIVNRKHLYRRGAIIVVVIIWIASVLFSSPQIYEYNIYFNPDGNYKACGSEGIIEHFETVYASFAFCGGYLVPLIIIAVCYTKVFLCVWKHGKRFRNTRMQTNFDLPSNAQSGENRPSRLNNTITTRMIKILKMLLSITATFVILWTPYFLLFGLTEITGLDDSTKFEEWPQVASRLMTVLSTLSNPLLYLVFNETFCTSLKTACGKALNGSQVGQNRVAPFNTQTANSSAQ